MGVDRINAKYWFLVAVPGGAEVQYLCPANNRETVKRSVGRLHRRSAITMLDWRELHELTGCLKPKGASWSDFARGNIHIPRPSKTHLIIWPL